MHTTGLRLRAFVFAFAFVGACVCVADLPPAFSDVTLDAAKGLRRGDHVVVTVIARTGTGAASVRTKKLTVR